MVSPAHDGVGTHSGQEETLVESFETLLYEERDGVAIVTLNRPEVHNAFDSTMQRELRALWTALRTNEDVRVIVLTGAGREAFCTGIDRTESIQEGYLGGRRRREGRTGPVTTPIM
jgi:enoyl-CoA hydratase/carnithine racemase